jgi:L,D-transpeptidase YcbB
VAHSQPSYGGGHPNLPAGVSFASNTSSGPSFFERLFGGPTPAPTTPGHRPPRRVISR